MVHHQLCIYAGTETTFQTYTSDEHKVCHEARSTIDTGTQTNVVDTKVQHLSSSLATPTASVGPPKYSTDYSDPTPIVLPKDTLEGKNQFYYCT